MVIPVGPTDGGKPTGKSSRYALAGTILLAVGGLFFVNLRESPDVFIVLTMLFAGPGLYLLIAGAVARGISVDGG